MRKLLLLTFMFVIMGISAKNFEISTGGENLMTLTKITDNEEPCINPHGGELGLNLFFAVRENKKYYNIYKKDNVFSSAMSQKTSGKNSNFAPTYSEKLDKIAFRCQNEGSMTSDALMMNNLKGKTLQAVTETPDAFENNPCFSPDGVYIVYDRQSYTFYKKGGIGSLFGFGGSTVAVEHSEIWLRNLTTGENVLLTGGYCPKFSPDGKSIAFVKYSSDAKSSSIWTMDLDGGNQVQITDAKKGYAFSPSWSPDGNRIIFESFKKDKKDSDLYIIDLDGSNLVQVTTNKSYDGQPYWSKDGFVYFVSDRGSKKGNYQIWRFKLEE